MKKISLAKSSLILLLGTLPFNFIVVKGVGSLYFSTIIIFLTFLLVLLFTKGALLHRRNAMYALFGIVLLSITTGLNVLFDNGLYAKEQLVFSIVHFQLILAFILANYSTSFFSKKFFFRVFLVVIFLFSLRVFIDDTQRVFNLSTVRGERIEALFAGAANNFALIVGMGFIISFFHLKKGVLKTLLCIYFFLVIILSMSRGALLGVVFTLFVVALYDRRGKILNSLLTTAFVMTIVMVIVLIYSESAQLFVEKFNTRFLSLFQGGTSIEEASSGRNLIFKDIYYNHITKSSGLEFLFGHGMGSINYSVAGYPYETSHNIIIDVFYRNGIVVLLGMIALFMQYLNSFLRARKNNELVLFGLFIFLHIEILVNPFVYAAQTGWIYGLMMGIIINRHQMLQNVSSIQGIT